MKIIKQLEQESKRSRKDGFSITESQLSLLRDVFDYDDEWLMRHISIKLLGHRNIVLEIDHINDCDYKDLEAWQEVSGDGSGEALPEVSQEERITSGVPSRGLGISTTNAAASGDHTTWTTWNGGDCPVAVDAIVEAKLKDGSITNPWKACQIRWHYAETDNMNMYNPEYNIIAYRIVK